MARSWAGPAGWKKKFLPKFCQEFGEFLHSNKLWVALWASQKGKS